ncbi:MAG: AAA family ATPase [Clostridia bacterium]|nr:AAA family ATPase [Clostridia bacterium]
MKIEEITLYNFGSYEGETVFDTGEKGGRNIVLVGGKNGAGKTTLFTAMRVCLYGYMSMGYKNQNAYYLRAITKLINNTAKLVRPVEAHVKMRISLNNGRGLDEYDLLRRWKLDESLSEQFLVTKNGISLTAEEVADFEKFLLSVIPPELFNLYFFDGEKIADFFMEEGSNTRIKNAFLTLCGYDTFDIMRKNFKRISAGKGKSAPALDDYLSAKDALAKAQEQHAHLVERLKACIDGIEMCEAEIAALEKDYHQKGGISQEEWDQKLYTLKDEEKKRETWNALLKKWANELVPFLMIRERILALKVQIDKENSSRKYRNFCEVIECPEIAVLLGKKSDSVKMAAFKRFGDNTQPILDLSIEQSAHLLGQINNVLEFEAEKIAKCRRAIKRSIMLSAKIREELDNSNVSSVQEYMQNRAKLFEHKSALLVQQVEIEHQVAESSESVHDAESQLARVQSRLEEELKQASITDISAKSIVMLDRLQQILYRRQIEKVEAFFRVEIKTLMRKTKFIDDIHIDDNFNTHLYRKEFIAAEKLQEVFATNSQEQVIAMLGEAAVVELMDKANAGTYSEAVRYYCNSNTDGHILPIEIDKTSLSNGEKQIFIMALYHSLVQLCNHELPFIIDTPFARIDTEHRRNISEHFFCGLNGQVFILSTNEEINSTHVQIMKDKIAATYMLENTDNKRTIVVGDSYFEV